MLAVGRELCGCPTNVEARKAAHCLPGGVECGVTGGVADGVGCRGSARDDGMLRVREHAAAPVLPYERGLAQAFERMVGVGVGDHGLALQADAQLEEVTGGGALRVEAGPERVVGIAQAEQREDVAAVYEVLAGVDRRRPRGPSGHGR